VKLRHFILACGVTAALALPAAVAAPARGDAKKGKAEYTQFGCIGCHAINGVPKGATAGPDLGKVGKKLTAAKIAEVINNPKQLNPNSVMPAAAALKMTPQNVANVSAYLASLK
jgi:mono/diheme cytochrome c family protein